MSGLSALDSNSQILLKHNALIKDLHTEGKDSESHALYAEDGSSIIVEGNTAISHISATGTSSSWAAGVKASGGTITLQKGVIITDISGDDAYAVAAYDGAKVSLNASASNEQVLIDQSIFSHGTGTEVSANFLSSDSQFSGLTLWDENDTANAGTINLTFKNGATWNLPADNTLHGTLTMGGGVVAFGGTTATQMGRASASGVTLTVDTLTGDNGIFAMRSDATDHLVVGTGSGNHLVRMASSGTTPSQEALDWLVKLENGNADFSLEGGQVELGNFKYNLTSDTDGDTKLWKLSQATEVDPDNPDDPTPTPSYSSSAQMVLAMASLGAQTTQHLNSLSDLRKRLGDVRQDSNTGLWVQVAGQKDRFKGFAGQEFKQTSSRFNFGADQRVGDWILGANFKYTDSEQKQNSSAYGKGESHSEGVNLYATYLNPNGLYADFVLSADKNHQHLSTVMIDGTGVKGSYHNSGVGVSTEVGYHWTADAPRGLFVEPQAELSYYKVNGADFTLTNGMTVSQGNYESLTGRLGVEMGKMFTNAAGTPVGSAAVRVGWKGDLSGHNSVTVNDLHFTDRLLKNRVYYGFDGDFRLTNNLRVYGYVEREEGNGYTKEVEAGAGLKYSF